MPPRVALIHYWLVGMRGGERVLERLLHLYPDADIFTHVYVPEAVSETIRARRVQTTFIQGLPWAKRLYQKYLPLMPLALEHLDLRGYDLVISSESGPAKGVIAAPDALHVCYCHSPMRYLWDHFHDYHENAGAASRAAMPLMFHGLRQWDTASAARVDAIMANSSFIQRRVKRAWGRESAIVHPPVPVAEYAERHSPGDFFLWVGQMTRYKRADLALDAFNRLGLPLLMVGDGDLAASLRQRAGPNITIKSKLSFAELKRAYATCRALIFTAEEDFGIVPVEANASGRPVIGYGRGGLVDTIIPEETGLFFGKQSVESLIEAVRAFEAWERHFDPDRARANAARFAPEHFDAGVRATIELAMAQR
ncbi:glycosyltransferase [Novosphingobium sp. MMS21-SN21R]|uniref:glycosyltransferase n=1 Tax=Novosphingobium sp. MMS21-SN21R TaxID=2969298 RepID=UPI002888E7FE|nr:glycosyltransferase [Novosphingobium sp. MMS21-SN21R]MDT0508394.1 glycosyltransferase [Novosphingobium sp. MMS21-SN21R]